MWVKIFKNVPSEICGRQLLKNFTWSILEYLDPYKTRKDFEMKPFYTNGKLAEQYFYETVKIFQNVYIFENYIGERNQVKEM